MADVKEDKLLDARGLLCPMPIVKAGKEMKSLTEGQVLKVLAERMTGGVLAGEDAQVFGTLCAGGVGATERPGSGSGPSGISEPACNARFDEARMNTSDVPRKKSAFPVPHPMSSTDVLGLSDASSMERCLALTASHRSSVHLYTAWCGRLASRRRRLQYSPVISMLSFTREPMIPRESICSTRPSLSTFDADRSMVDRPLLGFRVIVERHGDAHSSCFTTVSNSLHRCLYRCSSIVRASALSAVTRRYSGSPMY